jgi:glycosyltransferase 2 family protein
MNYLGIIGILQTMKRRWIYWLLIAAFVWIVASRFGEITELSATLSRGHFQWLLVAVGLQILHYVISSASYRTAFSTVGVESRVRELFPLLFGAMFVNVVAPTGGASGAALFVDHAARKGQSPSRAAAGILLQLIVSLMAFTVLLAAGMAYLGVMNRLESYQLGAAGILVFTVGLATGLLILAGRHPDALKRLLAWIQRSLNGIMQKIRRATLISDEWVDKQGADFIEAATAITTNPRGLIITLAMLLLAYVINIAGMYTLFLAFNQVVPIGSLVAGYTIGILFLIVSFTPQGIGVVEGIMPMVFSSLGVPNVAATLTVLAFRGLSLWLPLVIGFLLLRWTGVFKNKA